MRRIRVANLNHASAVPYQLLAESEWLRYEENTPVENARKLHEGEVDVALISTAEYAMHGGYVALDFGLGCLGPSDLLCLYSNVPPEELATVNIHSAASSTALLLRMLLSRNWGVAPLLVRRRKEVLLDCVVGRDASLVLHDYPMAQIDRFPVAVDIAGLWTAITARPYVSSVWAVRPGVLKAEHLRGFSDVFHRAVKARRSLVTDYCLEHGLEPGPLVDLIGNRLGYYLDAQMIQGLELFLQMAADTNLLPAVRYRSATLTLMGKHPPRATDDRAIGQVLEGVLDGARLGIRDGVRLAYEASIGDLLLVADTIRNRFADSRSLSSVTSLRLYPEEAPALAIERLEGDVSKAVSSGVLQARVIGTCLAASEPKFWEELLPRLQKRAPIVIEALSAVDLHWMSVMTGTSIEEIVARIVGAGLDVVGGVGGEMLVERVMSDGPVEVVSVADWLGCMRWVHRVGGSSRALMRVSRHDSWEDRLLHLQKLRSLHDEVPGFRSFSIVSDPSEAEHLEPEVRVRCAALSRIFLDNVPALEELDVQKGELTSNILSIGAGIRDVSIIDADSARSKMLAHDLERIGVFRAPDAPHLLARS